jgi:lipopolysaccharide transport system ATP-binding protein
MTDYAIEAEGLGKQYMIGEKSSDDRVRQALHSLFPRWRASGMQAVWALRDVSFRIEQGEAIGVIGRNGAGKSTLLKLLSRITAPTEGRARMRGRLGTLLEVGTGFHPELTGRDNIFLSGTILGMTRPEVVRKFDQIVAFSEVEEFIDTPVKRYSSGMYVRLAFAVASFLEPEILIVDEVLAVGDAAFQRKSLGRLNEASGREGRTVLFVSHNLQAIRTFCKRVLVLDKGRLVFDGAMEEGIERYLRSIPSKLDVQNAGLKDRKNRTSGALRFTDVTASDVHGQLRWQYHTGENVRLRFDYKVVDLVPGLVFHLQLRSAESNQLITVIREVVSDRPVEAGLGGSVHVELKNVPLRPGEVSIYAAFQGIDDRVAYDVVDANVDLPYIIIKDDSTQNHMRQGLISLDYRFSAVARRDADVSATI